MEIFWRMLVVFFFKKFLNDTFVFNCLASAGKVLQSLRQRVKGIIVLIR